MGLMGVGGDLVYICNSFIYLFIIHACSQDHECQECFDAGLSGCLYACMLDHECYGGHGCFDFMHAFRGA